MEFLSNNTETQILPPRQRLNGAGARASRAVGGANGGRGGSNSTSQALETGLDSGFYLLRHPLPNRSALNPLAK